MKLITINNVRKIRNSVKRLDRKWCEQVAKLMTKAGSEVFDTTKVYNITNDLRQNQSDRRLFIQCAKLHLKKIEQDQQDTLNILKSQQ